MKRIIVKLLIILLFVLVGCASTKKQIKAKLEPCIGEEIGYIIRGWGAPTSVYVIPNNGGKIYTWRQDGPVLTYKSPYTNLSTSSQSYCKIEFYTDNNDFIVRYNTEGECYL